MKVKLLNREESKNFYETWGKFSCKCYKTNPKYAANVGKKCHETRHYSGSRTFYFIFDIEDVPRSTIDQLARHEVGVVKNIQSQRYTDSSELGWYIPDVVKKHPELLEIWEESFNKDKEKYKLIVDKLEELEGYKGEKAREVARGILGIDINSSATVGFTIEALEHFMHKRLCFRAQEGIRKLALEMKKEIVNAIPELGKLLVAECFATGYCPENKMQCDELKDSYIPTKEMFDKIKLSKEFKELVLEYKKKEE